MAKRIKAHHKQPHHVKKHGVKPEIERIEQSSVPVDEEQVQHFINVISVFLKKANGRPVSRADLVSKCRGRGKIAFQRALERVCRSGDAAERRTGFVWAASAGMLRAMITRVSRTYGFAKTEDTAVEYFIPGRDLKGALPGDIVLLIPTGTRGDSPEGMVVSVLHEAEVQAAGTLVEDEGRLLFLADNLSNRPLRIVNADEWRGHEGDKVIASIAERGSRHSEHSVRVTASLGSADSARACAQALVTVSGVPYEFPADVTAEAERLEAEGISEEDLNGRLDLRDSEDVIFTIDGYDAKDLDDAISISATDTGYRLGVHIADVSHYVRPDTALDREAISRGTSIYYADQVIPMLPKALSNGICSLHPDVDRLAFSALLTLDEDGGLKSWEFRKTVIRSRVKGVYREVNALLHGTADAEIQQKYESVMPSLLLLNELRAKRIAARKRRGAPSLEAEESAFLIDENGVCTGIQPRTRAEGEELIEECMLLANEAAARLAKQRNLPFVYRVHALPPDEKSARLADALDRLEIPHPALEKPRAADYARILENVAEHPLKSVVHQLVLRSMAKADYETEPIGHFGLALEDYTHFTSPIRRYPDLAIHRILTAFLSGEDLKKAAAFAHEAAAAGTMTEQRAMQLERDCDDRYRAEYMSSHIGEEYDGMISGLTDFGIYVMLENTAEGLVPLDALEPDEYVYDGFFTMTGTRTGRRFTLGQPMRVRCVRASIGSGHIDFVPAEGSRKSEEETA